MPERFRTDRHRNPTAFTVDLARQGGLAYGADYVRGEAFESAGRTFYTATLLGNPVELTIQVIDRVGFVTTSGLPRWDYVRGREMLSLVSHLWRRGEPHKRAVIAWMYSMERGEEMRELLSA